MSINTRQLIEPKHLTGVSFNIRDQAKFQQALHSCAKALAAFRCLRLII